MLLPVLAAPKTPRKKAQAKTEIAGIVTAIEAYDQDYGRFPITDETNSRVRCGNNDFTYRLCSASRSQALPGTPSQWS